MESSPPRLVSIAARLEKWRWPLLLFAAVAAAAFFFPASRLELDESIESFYAEGDPYLAAYRESKATFGGDEFVMVAYEAENPTSEEELRRIRDFSNALSAIPGVREESTQDLYHTLRNPRASGLYRIALRLPATEDSLLRLSEKVLIGEDGKTVAIVLRLQSEDETTVPRAETFRQIRELAAGHTPRAYVAGEPIQVFDMFRYVEDDGWLLGLASSALLMIVILVFFRNLRWVVLPIAVIHATLVWTKGILFLTGMQLSMVSSMLTSLVTIIGIATVMHVTVTFREYRQSLSRSEAWQRTFASLAAPVFWTCLTTAIGFASLLSSSITPVRSFGIMMTLGTLLVPVACLLILPGGVLIGRWQSDPKPPLGEGLAISSLRATAAQAVRCRWLILLLTVALATAGGFGLSRLTVETDFSKNFLESSPIVQALKYFEERLGGVGSWEVAFDAPENLTEEYFDDVRDLAEELRELKLDDGTQLTKVVALTDGLDLIPRIPAASNGRGGLFSMIPRFETPSLEQKFDLIEGLQPEMLPSLYNADKNRMRIVLRALEQQPADVKLKLIDAVEATSQKYFPEARATGLYVLLAYLISSLLEDQLISFLLAATGVGLTMAIAFRSLRVGLISLVPNVLPILLVIGGMGLTGMPINIGTAMIASVSMGLTVDSTIHYITAYDRSRQNGLEHVGAVQAAHGSVGLALTLANISLVIGFSVLSLSNFVPLIYFGILVSVAMIGGLIGNLLLLPVLLLVRGGQHSDSGEQ